MEDQIHIGMALENLQLHVLIMLTRECLVYTLGRAVTEQRSQGQIKLNKQYQKTELSKLQQESGRTPGKVKKDLLSETEKHSRCLSEWGVHYCSFSALKACCGAPTKF